LKNPHLSKGEQRVRKIPPQVHSTRVMLHSLVRLVLPPVDFTQLVF